MSVASKKCPSPSETGTTLGWQDGKEYSKQIEQQTGVVCCWKGELQTKILKLDSSSWLKANVLKKNYSSKYIPTKSCAYNFMNITVFKDTALSQ